MSSIFPAGTKRAACAFLVFYYTTVSGLSWKSGCCLSDADIEGCDNALGSRLSGRGWVPRKEARAAPGVQGALAEAGVISARTALCCCPGRCQQQPHRLRSAQAVGLSSREEGGGTSSTFKRCSWTCLVCSTLGKGGAHSLRGTEQTSEVLFCCIISWAAKCRRKSLNYV